MSKVEKLDLLGVASLAIVAAALLVAWIAVANNLATSQHPRVARHSPVTLTEDGRMKLSIAAHHRDAGAPPVVTTRTASVQPSRGASL